jgi:hypothetical protein
MVETMLTKYFPATRSRYDAESTPTDLLAGMAEHLRDTSPEQYRKETEQLLKAKDEEESSSVVQPFGDLSQSTTKALAPSHAGIYPPPPPSNS